MGFSDEEQPLLTPPTPNPAGDEESSEATRAAAVVGAAPKDQFCIARIVYFILGMGYLLPWNAFITAVDYFSYLYPGTPVNRVFSVAYKLSCLLPLFFIIGWAHLSSATLRINVGLVIFTVSLVVVPVLDAFYVQTSRGVYSAYDVTVAAVILSGIGGALVQGGVTGSAGELPEIYMQAVVTGAAASGYDLTSSLFESSKQIVRVFLFLLLNFSEVNMTAKNLIAWRLNGMKGDSVMVCRLLCLSLLGGADGSYGVQASLFELV